MSLFTPVSVPCCYFLVKQFIYTRIWASGSQTFSIYGPKRQNFLSADQKMMLKTFIVVIIRTKCHFKLYFSILRVLKKVLAYQMQDFCRPDLNGPRTGQLETLMWKVGYDTTRKFSFPWYQTKRLLVTQIHKRKNSTNLPYI